MQSQPITPQDDKESLENLPIVDASSRVDTKALIADMVKRGEISEEDAANFARMFSASGNNGRRLGKHSIARAQRARAKQAKRKKKR